MWYHRESDYAVVAVTTCLSNKIAMDVSRFMGNQKKLLFSIVCKPRNSIICFSCLAYYFGLA